MARVDSGSQIVGSLNDTKTGAVPKVFEFETETLLLQMREWLGNRLLQVPGLETMKGDVRWYEASIGVETGLATERGRGLMQRFATSSAAAFARGKAQWVYEFLRDNPPVYSGQDLYSTSHQHLGSQAEFSNLLQNSTRQTRTSPTVSELRDEVDEVSRLLIRNSILQNTLQETDKVSGELVVFVRSGYNHVGFDRLRSQKMLSEFEENPYYKSIRVIRDVADHSGTSLEHSYDVFWMNPDGVRPAVFGEVRNFIAPEIDESDRFNTRKTKLGSSAAYALAAWLPHPVVRREVQA
ncbi:MAG: Mu-like prophage major head subunit gpT family protein [Acidobacteriota bacterium]